MTSNKYAVFVVATMLFSLGCIHVQKHPKTWDNVDFGIRHDVYSRISGKYENIGLDPKGIRVNLARLIAYSIRHDPSSAQERNAEWNELEKINYVEFKIYNDGVLAIAFHANGNVKTLIYDRKKGQYNYLNGMVRLHQGGDGSGDNIIAYESATLDLFMVGNDLVVHRHGGSAGIMLLVPVVVYDSSWARFTRVASD